MLFFELIYIAFCIVLAAVNAQLIKDGKKIYHGLNGAVHIAAALISWYVITWWLAPIVLLNTRIFFDWALCIFRKLPLSYVPLNPKSIADKIEKKLFGTDGYTPKAIYFLLSLLLNCIYLVFIHK